MYPNRNQTFFKVYTLLIRTDIQPFDCAFFVFYAFHLIQQGDVSHLFWAKANL